MKTFAIRICAFAAFAMVSGCNVYESIRPADSGNSYESLLLRGNSALNGGDYAAALNDYQQAMVKNPAGSEAYLFHSQAILSLYHVDYTQLKFQFDSKGTDSSRGVPFIDSSSTLQSVDSIYYPVSTAVKDLEHIIRLTSDTIYLDAAHNFPLPPDGDTASDGKISPSVARLDLGLLEAVRGMLVALDLDSNDHIDGRCGAGYDSLRKAHDCTKGDSSEAFRLASYKTLTQDIQMNNLSVNGLDAQGISTDPHVINAFINSTLTPIAAAAYNLDSVSSSLKKHGEDSLGNDIGLIVNKVQGLSTFLGYLHYADGIDNDFDHQHVENLNPPQTPTRMLWHDFDKDRGIRYDYDDSDRFAGYVASSRNGGSDFGNPGNIGHPVHRYLRPELYETFADWKKDYPFLSRDTAKTGRIALMVNRCNTIVDAMAITGSMTAAVKLDIKTNVCPVITTILKPAITPPSHSDWIGGTAGVDEEVLDNFDNDYDGLTDEDTRNTPGLDDDGDAALDMSMIGKPVIPMQWHDAIGHKNMCSNNVLCSCPDIDTTVAMPPVPFQRQFCIGSLEHRLYLARHGGKDSLYAYYTRAPGDAFSTHCEDQYYALDPAFRQAWNATSSEWQLACQFTHIWIKPRPPKSEWTGGVFGVDEEKPDGVDNDGDGWIDEDTCDPKAPGCLSQ